ncbi:MAG TPA: O-antigen ligase family protein, partial [Thermoanaerobaculia bacterium]|nr:O-antigen ligase family protein [Thermoanaerobaculia bacterium]
MIAWLRRRLSLPAETPAAIVLAIFFYLVHIICSGWVASSEGFVAFSLMAFLWAAIKKQITLSSHILYFPLIVYGIDSTVSALAAPREIHAFGENALWLKMCLFPAALILFREIPRARDLALRALLIFGVFSATYGLVQYVFEGGEDLEHRITGPASHVMTLSGLLLPVSLVFLVLWIHDRANVWLIAGTILVTFALLLTYTRSAWLGWLVAVGVLLILKWPRALVFAAPLLVFFLIVMPSGLFGRFVSAFDTKQESNLDRIRMIQAGVEIIKDHPLLGIGPANMKEVYPLYRRHDAPRFRIPHLHNNIVQLWAERGILALAAYILLNVLFVRECWRAWRGPGSRFAEMGVAVAVGLATAGLFEFNFGDTEVFWVLLDVMALVL